MTGLGNIDDVYKHYLKVIDENKQLKTLLRECRDVIKDVDTYCTMNADEGYILIYKIDNAIGDK